MFSHDNDTPKRKLILLRHTGLARFFHWITVVLLSLSIITGLWMGGPLVFGIGIPMRWLRSVHIYVNGILTAVVLGRVYYSLITGDVRHFLPRRGDFRRIGKLISYYLFLTDEQPYEPTKYNVGQRWIYFSWFFAWLFEAVTGIILANPARYVVTGPVVLGLQTIRLLRYLVAVYFVITILVHIYLSLTSDPAKLQAIFTGYIRVKDGESE